MSTGVLYQDVLKAYLSKGQDQINIKGIVEGEGGLALCLAYLYHHTGEDCYYSELNNTLDTLISSYNSDFSLGKGLAGLAWTIFQIEKLGLLDEDENWIQDIDTVLKEQYYVLLTNKNIDYFSGAMGILFYFFR